MPYITQEKQIQQFLINKPKPTKLQVYNFFDYSFINTEYYPEFVQQVLNNALDVTFHVFEKLSKKRKLFYLKSIANLIDVALSLKLWEFQLSRKDATWWWKGTINYYLYPSGMIKSLEELRYNGLAYNPKSTHEITLAVEGESELTFLKYIQENLGYANFNVETYCYKGKNQIVSLSRYIDEKTRQGIKVNIVCDVDGNSQVTDSFLNKLKGKCTVNSEFKFKRDFENSIPPIINLEAINKYLNVYKPTVKSLKLNDIEVALASKKPYIKVLEEKLNISMDKIKLAEIYGDIFIHIIKWNWHKIFNDKDQNFDYEIYDFLRFVVSHG